MRSFEFRIDIVYRNYIIERFFQAEQGDNNNGDRKREEEIKRKKKKRPLLHMDR